MINYTALFYEGSVQCQDHGSKSNNSEQVTDGRPTNRGLIPGSGKTLLSFRKRLGLTKSHIERRQPKYFRRLKRLTDRLPPSNTKIINK